MDYKFIAIPLAFALLRIWSLVVYLLFTYIGINVGDGNRHLVLAMLFLMVSLNSYRYSQCYGNRLKLSKNLHEFEHCFHEFA